MCPDLSCPPCNPMTSNVSSAALSAPSCKSLLTDLPRVCHSNPTITGTLFYSTLVPFPGHNSLSVDDLLLIRENRKTERNRTELVHASMTKSSMYCICTDALFLPFDAMTEWPTCSSVAPPPHLLQDVISKAIPTL